VDGVPADAFFGESDGIGFDDKASIAHVDHGGVLADTGPHQKAGVAFQVGKQPAEKIGR
jgi:hypothetical protein